MKRILQLRILWQITGHLRHRWQQKLQFQILRILLLELEARFNILNLEMKSKVGVYSQNLVNLRNLLESYNPSNSLKLKMDELHKCKNELEKLMNLKLEKNDSLNYKREQLIFVESAEAARTRRC